MNKEQLKIFRTWWHMQVGYYKVVPPTLNTIPIDKPINTKDIEYADL